MTGARLSELVDRAFDYRGYVTLRRNDGSEVVGFVYDRTASHVEILDETATRRTRIPLAEIADISFTGEDAARKSQDIWERRKGTLEPRDTPADGGWQDTGPVLVLVALERELSSVARALGVARRGSAVRGRIAGGEVVAHAVGIGEGARRALAEERPRVLVSCGFAGGLDPALAPGDLLLATAVRTEDGDVLAPPEGARRAAAAALSGLRVSQGELLCTTAVAATPDEKRKLAATGALAVDMESHPAARAAKEAGTPWLAVRAIVDPLESSLPPFTREAHGGYLWPALQHALSGPRAAAGLVRLARDARRAGDALEEALRRLVPALMRLEAKR
jgi:nucleoside phosphorylase